MKLSTPDFKSLALDFCQKNNCLDVELHKKSMELGYSLAITDFTKKIATVREGLNASRERSNRPQ